MSPADLQHATELFQSGQHAAAEAACRAFLQDRPDHAKALMLMSAIQYRLGNADAALAFLQQAIQVLAGDVNGLLDAALALQRIGRLDEARTLLESLEPGNPQAAELLAQNEWRMGHYEASLARFRDAVERWPQRAEAYSSCARAMIRLGMTMDAQNMLDRALIRFPRHADLHRLKIACLLDRQNPSFALLQLRKMPADSDEDVLLQGALRSVFASTEFRPPSTASNPRLDAKVRSHQWLLNAAARRTGNTRGPSGQPANLSWFGTDTGLLEWAVRHASAPGILLEFGVFHGLSINLLARWSGREVHGFDSFEGLPEDWNENEPAGSYSTGGQLPAVAANVTLHRGWFEHTLPSFFAGLDQPVSLAHIDCDLYASTRCVLENLSPHLQHGSILVFDDFLAYPGYEQHEFKAAHEFFDATEYRFELEAAVLLGRSVAFRVK